MQQYANIYESSHHPLHYADNTLAQRGDVVLYLHEEEGRIVDAKIMRVWDGIYYQDGMPIGIVLIDAESRRDALPELQPFVIHNAMGEEEKYFRGTLTITQEQIFGHVTPLFRLGRYVRKWDKNTQMTTMQAISDSEPYPEPDDIYDEFVRETVYQHAQAGNPYCLFVAGLWKRNEFYPHQAIQFFEQAARLDFAAAWLELGLAYEGSDLLARNPAKAMACLHHAMKLGNPLAAYRVAHGYITGDGIAQSDAAAIACLKTAMAGNIMPAVLDLAKYLYTGTFNHIRLKNSPYRLIPHIAPKYRDAAKLFAVAAQANWTHAAVAKFYLAECYRMGQGVRANAEHALLLYKEAVRLGDIMAEEIQIACFYTGNTLRLQAAVDSGDPHANYLLGRMLWNGERTDKDRVAGKRYLKFAAESSHECAEEAVKLLQQKEDVSWAFASK